MKKWSFEEDYIVGKFYLSHVETWREHMNVLMDELLQNDYRRDKGSVRMRVQNFASLHTGVGLENASIQTKAVYGALVDRVEHPQVYSDLQQYIEENYVCTKEINIEKFSTPANGTNAFVPIEPIGPSFKDVLFKYIDDKGMKDSDVYNRCCVGRDVFYNIRKGKSVSKRTVKQLCFGVQLPYEDAVILMASAGYAFSDNDIGDLVVVYFLKNKIFDIHTANIELHDRKQALLF